VLFDYETGAEYTPLSSLHQPSTDSVTAPVGRFMVYDSLLSEFAALGFEYGYSVESSEALVVWEAQFGDFANGAQIIIDNFLASAGEKWGQSSALTLLLPHGYEGQGPEHSSARLERFLTICADDNLTVAQPTTAAQYFHLLRSQARRSTRRPLVVMTPKSLLRARQARSLVADFVQGTWHEVLDDGSVERAQVRRLVLCSGKVAYDAMARRDRIIETGGSPIAVVRVEQLYPWPEQQISDLLAAYRGATEVVWLQEEPENMGAWNFVHGHLHSLVGSRYQLRHVSRAQSGSPATGSSAIHQLEQEDLLERSMG
jgi:2-oxoglutarate dehydrogenase E1 component